VQANGTKTASVYCSPAERVHANAERGLQSGERVHANAERGLQSGERVHANAERGLQYTRRVLQYTGRVHANAERAEQNFSNPLLQVPPAGRGNRAFLVPLAKRGNQTPTWFPSRSAGTKPPHGSPREAGGT
jgi:hypothetical protein